jgi:hypothetical protein
MPQHCSNVNKIVQGETALTIDPVMSVTIESQIPHRDRKT